MAMDASAPDANAADAATLPGDDAGGSDASPVVSDAALPDAGLGDAALMDASAQDRGPAADSAEDPSPVAVISMNAETGTCAAPCIRWTQRVNAPITLSGLSSTGAEPLSYVWEIAQRPAGSTVELESPGQSTTTLTADVEGTYQLGLWVQDVKGRMAKTAADLQVFSVRFQPVMAVTVDGQTLSCLPTCPAHSVMIGADMTVDGASTLHEPAHGELVFAWEVIRPQGSRADVVVEGARLSFKPDVDGAWEIRMRVSDAKSSGEAAVNFIIASPWSLKVGCTASSLQNRGGWIGALLLGVAVRRFRRRLSEP
jgi:hypothetical protein